MANGEYDFTVQPVIYKGVLGSEFQFYVTEYDAGWSWVLKNPSNINDTEEGGDFDTPCEAIQDAINYAKGERQRIEMAEEEAQEDEYERDNANYLNDYYKSTRL